MIATYDVNLYCHKADGTTIKITEDGDGLGMLCVKADTDYFGKIDFTMDLDDGEAFANGLIRAIEFIRESQK